jgi:transcriptional regulator NrdR family protein
MLCPKGCKSGSSVLRTVDEGPEVRRHRECRGCRGRYWTVEGYELEVPKAAPVVKQQQQKVPRKRTWSEEEKEFIEELEKAQTAPWSVSRAEKELGSDIAHYNELD